MHDTKRIWSFDGADLPRLAEEVAEILRACGVVALPTETYYGLAASCRQPRALQRVLDLKARPPAMPLLLLVGDLDMARRFAPAASSALEALADAFWPGPLTVVVPAPAGLDPVITAGGATVALRHPDHPVAAAVAGALGHPVTGTSANRSGAAPTRLAEAIELQPGVVLDGIVDAGPTPGGPASTLIDITQTPARILREGAVAKERIAGIIDVRLL